MAPNPLVITSKKYPFGTLPQAVDVVRRRLAVAAPHDHAVAAAGAVVAGRAVDVEALLAAQDHFLGDRERESVDRLAVGALAGVEDGVVVQVAARHGALDQRARGAAVGEEIAGPERNVFRLVVHVLPAGGETARGRAAELRADAELWRLVRNFGHLSGLQRLQELARLVAIEQRVGGFDAQEESIAATPARSAAR